MQHPKGEADDGFLLPTFPDDRPIRPSRKHATRHLTGLATGKVPEGHPRPASPVEDCRLTEASSVLGGKLVQFARRQPARPVTAAELPPPVPISRPERQASWSPCCTQRVTADECQDRRGLGLHRLLTGDGARIQRVGGIEQTGHGLLEAPHPGVRDLIWLPPRGLGRAQGRCDSQPNARRKALVYLWSTAKVHWSSA